MYVCVCVCLGECENRGAAEDLATWPLGYSESSEYLLPYFSTRGSDSMDRYQRLVLLLYLCCSDRSSISAFRFRPSRALSKALVPTLVALEEL